MPNAPQHAPDQGDDASYQVNLPGPLMGKLTRALREIARKGKPGDQRGEEVMRRVQGALAACEKAPDPAFPGNDPLGVLVPDTETLMGVWLGLSVVRKGLKTLDRDAATQFTAVSLSKKIDRLLDSIRAQLDLDPVERLGQLARGPKMIP